MTQWKELKAIIMALFWHLSERSFSPSLSLLLISGPWIEFSKGSNDHLLLIFFYGDISFIFHSFFKILWLLLSSHALFVDVLPASPSLFFCVPHHSSALLWTVKSMYLPTALLNTMYLSTDVHSFIQYHCKTPKCYTSGQENFISHQQNDTV